MAARTWSDRRLFSLTASAMSGPWVCTPRETITISGSRRAVPVPVTEIRRGGLSCDQPAAPAHALRARAAAARARGTAKRTPFIGCLPPFNHLYPALYQTQDACPSVRVPEIQPEPPRACGGPAPPHGLAPAVCRVMKGPHGA